MITLFAGVVSCVRKADGAILRTICIVLSEEDDDYIEIEKDILKGAQTRLPPAEYDSYTVSFEEIPFSMIRRAYEYNIEEERSFDNELWGQVDI